MNVKGIIGAALTALTLAACSDDTGVGPGRQEGYLYFNVSEGRGWTDDTKVSRSAVEAPMQMECSLNGQPIYLHTEVTPTMSPQLEASINNGDSNTSGAETRGIRYTDDVFSLTGGSGPKISNFGVYATRTADRGVILNYAQIGPNDTETATGYDWNVKEQEIEGVWDSGTADFYGYAPYFANPSAANGLSMTADGNGVPFLTYTVPTDVTKQLDILTAKHIGVSKGSDVELSYDHVMSAIKFKFTYGHTPDGSATGAQKDNFQWSDGLTTYDVKVTNIQITGVYKKGTWQVGENPYGSARWTVDTSAGTGDFSYAPAKTLTGASSPVELNPDADGNVFMMLPQQVPAGAKVLLTCELTPDGESTATKNMSLSVNLLEPDGTTPKTWLPGHTYTYTMSLSDFVYVFDYNTDTTKTYPNSGDPNFHYTNTADNYEWDGYYEEDVFIRSYKVDSRGVKSNVDWEPQYLEYESTAVGTGTDNDGTWKTGSNGWIHIYDKTNGTYDENNNEVTANHVGANEDNTDNEKLFKIAIGSIMTPIVDLSLWNYNQTQRWKGKNGAKSGRSTANCYIVAGPGTYRIPLIYGNAWTNGNKNELAYKTSKSADKQGNYMLKTNFLNCNGVPLQSPFINVDLADQVDHAVLIWEEGVDENGVVTQALRESNGGSASGTPSDPNDVDYYHDLCNMGTVVKVKWDIDDAITYEDDYNQDKGDFKVEANYLQFKIDPAHFNYGNAVVGICDNTGKILWSWHIWITDPTTFTNGYQMNVDNHNVTFASTNIGWVDAESTPKTAPSRNGQVRLVQKESDKKIYINASQKKSVDYKPYFTNVLYQFGRKDPMRGIVDFADDDKDFGAPRGAAGVRPYANKYEAIDYSPNVGNGIVEVQTLIQDPNSIYGMSQGDLYPSSATVADNKSYCNLWGTNITEPYQSTWGTWKFEGKTIYDPSPVGYCVPPARYLMTFARSSLLIPSRNWANGFVNIDPSSAVFPIKCKYERSDVGTMYFCASGLRSSTAGDGLMARGYERSPAALGFYHTSTPYSRDENYQLHLYFYPAIDTHTKILGDHCEALSVLPVVWSGEVVELDDAEERYLTFMFPAGGTLYWMKDDSRSTNRTIEYSFDGTTWTTMSTPSNSKGSGNSIVVNNAGGTVYIRGNNSTYCSKSGLDYDYCYFDSNADYEVSGNIMSLFYGSDFKGKEVFPSGSSFNLCSIFYTGDNLNLLGDYRNAHLVDASDLVLPATTLTTSCYESMFEGCYNLEGVPNLPATSGATDCYKEMFNGCSNLHSVNVMLDPLNSTTYTNDWLKGVASSGNFYYMRDATWRSGSSGIPSGWDAVPIDL